MAFGQDDPGSQDEESLRSALAAALQAAQARELFESRPAVSSAGKIDDAVVAFTVFAKLMETDGIRAALYSVLRKSDYRFIGIFRFKNGKATSAVHVDREDLKITQADEVDEASTYCNLVRHTGRPFMTADASIDPRTAGHVAREVIRSYCGVPILDSDGSFIGTLCHYDLVPRNPSQLNLALLAQISGAAARSGLIPPYPQLP